MLLRPSPAPPLQPDESRRRLLDNPRVLAVAVGLLIGLLGALYWITNRTTEIAPRLVTDVLLYALLAVDLILLAALLFVLARSLLKLWVEQRQAAPFARFRAKLVAALLAMTIVPAVLVLLSGSQIIRDSAARWFSEPVDEVLGAAQLIARQYYEERQEAVGLRATHLARVLPPAAVAAGDVAALTALIENEPRTMLHGMVELYRTVTDPGRTADVLLVTAVESANLPTDHVRASADLVAARAVASRAVEATQDDLNSGGLLLRSAAPIVDADGSVAGVVVVSQHLRPEIKARALLATAAYENYQGLQVLKGPIQGIYQSVFLAVSLLVLMSATWLGLYLAKRITRPVQTLAEGARAIGAGQLDVRLEPETGDELGSLFESFNMMAAELRTSRAKFDLSRQDLERKNHEVEARRRYIETILERIATGVVSLDAEGHVSTVNGAAARLLRLDAGAIGRPAAEVFGQEPLRPLLPLVEATRADALGGIVRDITLASADREIHLFAAATVLTGEHGRTEGAVMVFDDVTPLIRTQRVAAWKDVARRLAHEIKNPLTPIQLSAERLRRRFATAAPETRAFVDECAEAIIVEVEALKGLVDEFAQFARMRGPRTVPADLNRLIDETLQLYAGLLQQGSLRLERHMASGLPPVRLDTEQIRQVIVNLLDNAVEALGGATAPTRLNGAPPTIRLTTMHDARNGVVRMIVSDNGPGVPVSDREKLFMPYYSTKGRGSGLGLAIVRRIVAEHGGVIEAGAAEPSGTIFTVELPCLPS